MIAATSSETATLIGVVLLLGVVAFGFAVGPKWWHWGSFIVLTVVLFIPLAMAFFDTVADRGHPERRHQSQCLDEEARDCTRRRHHRFEVSRVGPMEEGERWEAI